MKTLEQVSDTRIMVLGGSGLLGHEIVREFLRQGATVAAPTSREVSLADPEGINDALRSFKPELVVNAAAFTDVDGAQSQASLVAKVNSGAVRHLAQSSLDTGFRLLQISTASVFSGTPKEVFGLDAELCPTNVYNESKAQAERYCSEALAEGANVAWIRTYWLYGPARRSFVDFVVDRLSTGSRIQVVSDQWGQPTSARDLASFISLFALDRTVVGPIHGVNSGVASRLQWAMEIAQLLELDSSLIDPVSAVDFAAAAPRPVACFLEEPTEGSGLRPLRHWSEALRHFLADKGR